MILRQEAATLNGLNPMRVGVSSPMVLQYRLAVQLRFEEGRDFWDRLVRFSAEVAQRTRQATITKHSVTTIQITLMAVTTRMLTQFLATNMIMTTAVYQ